MTTRAEKPDVRRARPLIKAVGGRLSTGSGTYVALVRTMTPTERDKRRALRAQLEARLAELRRKVSAEIVPQPEETFSGIAGEVQDSGDVSVALEQTGLRGARVERNATELTAVGRAIERLRDGSYGRCVDCDLEIDPGRLAVLPQAERCSYCQELFERRPAYAMPR